MAKPVLFVGNKNYSSWSLRPYMALKQSGIAFDEKLIRFGEPAFGNAIRKVSAAGQVPVLQHGKLTIWDSLAILEYVAETWPSKNLWPKNRSARAMARSVCAEMHTGFGSLRNACPMNIRRPVKPIPMAEAVMKNLARIDSIWSVCRKNHGKGGDFLFGKFSNADAMFAPIASRINTFDLKISKANRAYVNAVLETKAYCAWKTDALQEPWMVAEDEVD